MLNKLGRATPSLRNCEPKATARSCFFATIDTTIMGRKILSGDPSGLESQSHADGFLQPHSIYIRLSQLPR